MFLESSFVPIPSELVLVTAGMTGLNLFGVALAAAAGSTLGSIVGWGIGHFGGRPAVKRWGHYILVSEAKVRDGERWFSRWGSWTVLISRLIPVIPFKVFSITAGILGYDLKRFLLFTFVGSVPRALLLASVGRLMMDYGIEIISVIVLVALVAIVYWKILRRS